MSLVFCVDLHVGNYIIQNSNKCNGLCDERKDCCDSLATCRCGTHTGKYECICQTGYYGNGLKKGCTGNLAFSSVSRLLWSSSQSKLT